MLVYATRRDLTTIGLERRNHRSRAWARVLPRDEAPMRELGFRPQPGGLWYSASMDDDAFAGWLGRLDDAPIAVNLHSFADFDTAALALNKPGVAPRPGARADDWDRSADDLSAPFPGDAADTFIDAERVKRHQWAYMTRAIEGLAWRIRRVIEEHQA